MAACETAPQDPGGSFTCEAAEASGEDPDEEAGEKPGVEAGEEPGVEAGEVEERNGSSSRRAGGRKRTAELAGERKETVLPAGVLGGGK